jgi:signal transduction histidine kinase
LRRARDPECYRASLTEISDEAERMTRLVDDLLFLARNDAQPAEMPKEPLDLRVVLADVAAELRQVAELRRICVCGPRESGDSVVVSGNRAALRRLFLVLIDNAIKYSYPASDVIVEVANRSGCPAVTIEDFGIGIEEAERAHIFKRFYQADKARADGGFGLGLSLADSIARAHRATIDVKSEPGAGSRFSVVFRETPA